jgi:hypothetical protein
MPVQTITITCPEHSRGATGYAYAVNAPRVSGKCIVSLVRGGSTSRVSLLTASPYDATVVVDPITGQTDVMTVYRIDVELSQNPHPWPNNVIYVKFFDEQCELGQLGQSSKFSAACTRQWENSHNGIKLQTTTDGFYPQQARHKTGFRLENGQYRTILGFGDEYAEGNGEQFKDALVFIGDENSKYIPNATAFALLYEEFWYAVEQKTGSRGRKALGSEKVPNYITNVINELNARHGPNPPRWIDQFVLQRYMNDPLLLQGGVWSVSHQRIEEWWTSVTNDLEFADNTYHGVKSMLFFTFNNSESREGSPNQEKMTLLKGVMSEMMARIEAESRIAAGVWWHFQKDGDAQAILTTSATATSPPPGGGFGNPSTVDGGDYVLNELGVHFKAMCEKYSRPTFEHHFFCRSKIARCGC